MANYKLTLENHPSQARFQGKPLFDDVGKPVPLLPDQRSIRLDGQVIAYVSKTSCIFIHGGLPPAIKTEALVLAETAFDSPLTSTTVPEIPDEQEEENE